MDEETMLDIMLKVGIWSSADLAVRLIGAYFSDERP
jgi:hypothetical protein